MGSNPRTARTYHVNVVSRREAAASVLDDSEVDAGRLQPCDECVTHRLRRRDLAGDLGQVVADHAQRRLAEHLGGLVVTRVAARYLGDHGTLGLAGDGRDESDPKPRPRTPLRGRTLTGRHPTQESVPGRRYLRRDHEAARTADEPDCLRQTADGGVLAVAEVRPVLLQGPRRALHDERVDDRQRDGPALVAGHPMDLHAGATDVTSGLGRGLEALAAPGDRA